MISHLLFPNHCLQCNQIIEGKEVICTSCLEQISFTHFDFYGTHPFSEACKSLFPVENASALMYFNKKGLSKKIIHELKYKSRKNIGAILANWTLEKINFSQSQLDLLVSVPLHPKKEKERGYNQLHVFVESLSDALKIPYNHNILKRNYFSKAQALKDKKHRSENQNLFSLNQNIENTHLLLIDDVFTTGNTLSSIAWEILKQKNNKISVLVMAYDY